MVLWGRGGFSRDKAQKEEFIELTSMITQYVVLYIIDTSTREKYCHTSAGLRKTLTRCRNTMGEIVIKLVEH